MQFSACRGVGHQSLQFQCLSVTCFAITPACAKILAQTGAKVLGHNSPAVRARGLFKPCKDEERLVVSFKEIGKFGI